MSSHSYPATLTPALGRVLGMMVWETGPIAHALRAAGQSAELHVKLYSEIRTACERCAGTGAVRYQPGGMLFSCPRCTPKLEVPR